MRIKNRASILAVVIWLVAHQAQAQTPTVQQLSSIPEWVTTAMARAGLDRTLAFDAWLNPCCHRGDFDGDGAADFAVLVKERATAKSGIAFIHRGTGRVFVVGAGRNLPNGGDDFSWMDTWVVFHKGTVSLGASDERPPMLRGDALLVSKTEAASAILWWNGTDYRWYQQGD